MSEVIFAAPETTKKIDSSAFELSDEEIAAYWETGEPQDKAGSYAIQGLGAVFVKEIRGSYSGVVGLPIEVTCELLREFAVPWWTPLVVE